MTPTEEVLAGYGMAAALFGAAFSDGVRAAEQVHRAAIWHDLDPAEISAALAEAHIPDFDRALEVVVDHRR